MGFDKREMIAQLRFEISLIRDGAYNPSAHHPRRELRMFRDSVTCLNVALETKKDPCTNCFLCEFVPADRRQEEFACHHIPLNEKGDTVASLMKLGDREKLESVVLSWLYATITRLEKELARESAGQSVA